MTSTAAAAVATGATADDDVGGGMSRGSSSPDRPWRDAVRYGSRFWAGAMVVYLVITLCAWQVGDRPQSFATMFGSWRQWDTWWYLSLATQGYPTTDLPGPTPPEAFYAFYPLFPLLIRAVHVVVPGHIAISAFIVSVTTFLALLIVLYRFLDQEMQDRATVNRTMWYLLAFPTAFFLAAPYPMALFLVLALASIYFMRQGRWWAAGLIGAVATSSRASALLLVGVFVLEYLRQHDWKLHRLRPDALWVALVPAGLVAYLAYAQARVGNAMAPFDGQDYWQHTLNWPWVGLVRVTRYVVGTAGPDFVLFPVVDLALVGLMAVLLIAAVVGRYRLDRDQLPFVAFGLGVVLFAISFPMPDSDPIKGASRYMLEVFAGFMMLARIGASAWFDRAYVGVALPVQTLLLVIHLHAGWVA